MPRKFVFKSPDEPFEEVQRGIQLRSEEDRAEIEKEIAEAKVGRKALIRAKMNNLEDPLIIQKLYEASQEGVTIDLVVRSVCRLIPGKKGLSENINVSAITGRFLEHSRCFYFHSAGDDICLIGSADWMHRNLDARVEVLVPIEEPALKKYLQFVLDVCFLDNKQRWVLNHRGEYERVERKKGEKKIGTHDVLMNHTKDLIEPIPYSDFHKKMNPKLSLEQ
jgi:polyphosphate kinase